jgi:photosystem II stability/assembly factor-like uncharacterized protein
VRLVPLLLTTLPLAAQIGFVPQNSGVQASLRGLAAVNGKVAWASGTGGTVLLTTDGGTLWQSRPVPGADALDFRDIEAFNARRAVALTAGEGEKSRLYRTRDGGATWQLLRTNADPKGFWDAIAFWDEKRGVLMGDPVDGRFVIETTEDGGQTWQRRPTPPALPGEGGFAASGTCLVVRGKREIWFATGQARVFRSLDGGQTWTVTEAPLRQKESSAGIFSIALGPGGTAIAVGGDYRKPQQETQIAAYSSDAGATWTPATGLRGYRSGAVFLDSRTVVAVGTSGADLSTDGGKTWQALDNENYNAVQRGWAVGPKGRIARMNLPRVTR